MLVSELLQRLEPQQLLMLERESPFEVTITVQNWDRSLQKRATASVAIDVKDLDTYGEVLLTKAIDSLLTDLNTFIDEQWESEQ